MLDRQLLIEDSGCHLGANAHNTRLLYAESIFLRLYLSEP